MKKGRGRVPLRTLRHGRRITGSAILPALFVWLSVESHLSSRRYAVR